MFAASAITLVYPWAAREAVDAGMGGKTAHDLDLIVLLLIGVFIVNAVLVWLRHYSMSWLGERVVADLRALVFDRILSLPLSWFHERRSGELVGRLASDVTVIEGVVGTELSMALRNSIQMIGAMVLLFVIDVKLTLLMLGIVPPIVAHHDLLRPQDPQDDARRAGRAREGLGPGPGVDRRDRDGAVVRARGATRRSGIAPASSGRSTRRSTWCARGRGSSRRR